MRVSCLQENLAKGLSIVGRAVAVRSTLPVTQNVLIATDNSRLKLAATNLEIAVCCWIGAKVEEEGALTVPSRILTEFVSALPNDKIALTAPAKGKVLHMACGRYEARMSGIDADDFPPIPDVGGDLTATIEPDVLRTTISQVALAAAQEDSRPVLTGVNMSFSEDMMTLAAADGFRLAVRKTKLSAHVTEASVIVPARALMELARLLADQADPVEVTVNTARSQVLFRLKNVELVSQLLQGTFPNYTQLIPQGHASRAVVDAGEFQRATKTAAIFARDASGIVRLQVTPSADGARGKLTVMARAEEVGDNQSEIDAVVEGDAAKIAFNSKYLLDVLSVLDKGQVALETTSPSSPGVIRPVGDDSYVHVVMPMFVQW